MQAGDMVLLTRVAVEKSLAWGIPLYVAKIDLHRCFPRLSISHLAATLERRGLPVHLRAAFLRELLGNELVPCLGASPMAFGLRGVE